MVRFMITSRQKSKRAKCTNADADKLPSSRLDWGFAGTSFSTAPTEAEAAEQKALIAHAKWTHWVDSRHADAEAVSDAGDMFALQDGRTLEMGSMVNPETGELGKYEEIWRDVEVVGTGVDGGKGEGGGGNSQDDAARQKGQRKKTCTVLVLDAPEHQARGMVVQLGQFCQGILRCGDEVSSERWIWAETRGWLREVSLGRFFVPCGVCCEGAEKVPEVGGKVALGEWEWWVVEKGEV